MAFGVPAEGRGFSVDDLHKAEQAALRSRLDKELPLIRDEIILALVDYKRGQAAYERACQKLAHHLGPQNVRAALEELGKDADALLAAPPAPKAAAAHVATSVADTAADSPAGSVADAQRAAGNKKRN